MTSPNLHRNTFYLHAPKEYTSRRCKNLFDFSLTVVRWKGCPVCLDDLFPAIFITHPFWMCEKSRGSWWWNCWDSVGWGIKCEYLKWIWKNSIWDCYSYQLSILSSQKQIHDSKKTCLLNRIGNAGFCTGKRNFIALNLCGFKVTWMSVNLDVGET